MRDNVNTNFRRIRFEVVKFENKWKAQVSDSCSDMHGSLTFVLNMPPL